MGAARSWPSPQQMNPLTVAKDTPDARLADGRIDEATNRTCLPTWLPPGPQHPPTIARREQAAEGRYIGSIAAVLGSPPPRRPNKSDTCFVGTCDFCFGWSPADRRAWPPHLQPASSGPIHEMVESSQWEGQPPAGAFWQRKLDTFPACLGGDATPFLLLTEPRGSVDRSMPIRLAPMTVDPMSRKSRHTPGCDHAASQRPAVMELSAPLGDHQHFACRDHQPEPGLGRQPDRHGPFLGAAVTAILSGVGVPQRQ